jgi:hypothetical protein
MNGAARARPWGRRDLVPVALSVGLIGWTVVMGHRRSMWLDETISARYATSSFDALVRTVRVRDANQGPYYLAL